MIGISTIFYGFRNKNIVDKVEKLVNIFNNMKLRPLVQIGASYPEDDFNGTVSKLLDLKKSYNIKYALHQSIWLPDPDFFINIASSDKEIQDNSITTLKKSIDFGIEIKGSLHSFIFMLFQGLKFIIYKKSLFDIKIAQLKKKIIVALIFTIAKQALHIFAILQNVQRF